MTPTLEWFGCTTFRLEAGGAVTFLDAYIDRIPGADGPSGATAAGVTAADWVLVGHSHFDHMWGAETIARNTGAMIVGSYETTRYMRAAGVPEEQLIAVAGGERIQLTAQTSVRVYPAQHSCWWAPWDDANPTNPCFGAEHLDHSRRQELTSRNVADAIGRLTAAGLAHVSAGLNVDGADGGVLAYLIETDHGSVFFKDTPGHWSGIMDRLHADVAILGVSGRPQIDGEAHQGSLSDFIVDECNSLAAQRFIPCHHDNYLPGFSEPFGTDQLREAIETNTTTEFVQMDYETSYPLFDGLSPSRSG